MHAVGAVVFWGSFLILVSFGYSEYQGTTPNLETPSDRTRAIALLFSCLQCFPAKEEIIDPPTQQLLQVHETFHPEEHLDDYKIREDIVNLVEFVEQWRINGTPNDVSFTNAPRDIAQMNVILKVLYHNTDNWSLFYDTATWLLHRVNTVQLWWAVTVSCLEKFSDSITLPSHTETFPQLYAPKNDVLQAAGLSAREEVASPLQYWISDPKIHEFHTQWHMDNPFWWNDTVYEVTRDRKGELFMYMHHQISVRYRAEWWSNRLKGDVTPLEMEDDFRIPEGYTPDIINVNYEDLFPRETGKRLGDYGEESLAELRTYYSRLEEGIKQGYFLGEGGTQVPIRGNGSNGVDVLGAAVESTLESPNLEYYGSFHNFFHREIAGMDVPQLFPIPGTQSHPETAMRDPIFYRLHARVDQLFLQLKSTLPPYSKGDLAFRGISVENVGLQSSNSAPGLGWGLPDRVATDLASVLPPPVLRTYFTTATYDISTAARPCKGVNDAPVTTTVKTLNHVPFSYQIVVKSTRSQVAYGMVRIFIWPEFTPNGTRIQGDAIRTAAIELDRFRVRLDPRKNTVIKRSSLDSSITKQDRAPGLKELFQVSANSDLVSNPNIRRACGFPSNLLIPRGTHTGMPFKMVVYLSDETESGFVDSEEDPHFSLCGALNGRPFPDARPMGFPFDRPGTRFNVGRGELMKNVREIPVLIKHQEDGPPSLF